MVVGWGRMNPGVGRIVVVVVAPLSSIIRGVSSSPSWSEKDGTGLENGSSRKGHQIFRTAFVADWTADSSVVNGPAAIDVQRALLHHAGSGVPDAVAELAGLLWIGWNLGALRVEFVLHLTAVPIYASHIGGRGRVD